MILNSLLMPSQLVYLIIDVSAVVVRTGNGSAGSTAGAGTPLRMRVFERSSEMRVKVGATRTEKWLPLRTMDFGSPMNCFSSPA